MDILTLLLPVLLATLGVVSYGTKEIGANRKKSHRFFGVSVKLKMKYGLFLV